MFLFLIVSVLVGIMRRPTRGNSAASNDTMNVRQRFLEFQALDYLSH